ncbi:hypothetical protein LYSHEL_24530 [Lysobacter helvus]|uniref:Anti-sigma factor n=2 Tax=Lysobacteraceae TaxID=32033 RepID=A0ABM7Q7S4_9GAMM|nr:MULTISPECIES: hypothetical protein [Lysobacter]BCT93429.1 hypothetical protein LYSCAS_24530 [Lysobacter caseinilyticus]BCT96582.1 hypothetical protein LYSHEL_24530 [Lysobacter helvus]
MIDIQHDDAPTPLPDALRWELRALRRDLPPSTDLWPSIAQRLAATPQRAPASPTVPLRNKRLVPFAIAASLALVAGLTWQLRPAPAPTGASGNDPHHQLLAREADAMTLEYQAALKVMDTGVPTRRTSVAPELQVLDRSAAQIRTALQRDPDARFLLDRLQRTYTRRLALTQRIATLAT